jgi:hypothetical protein
MGGWAGVIEITAALSNIFKKVFKNGNFRNTNQAILEHFN